ncbi:SMI1/KNR4 family protein [Serratia rubidaea]|nr:SMI1/KNR4 family protein [Serratia rubidaea]
MNEKDIIESLNNLERKLGGVIPASYKKFLSKNVKGSDAYEIESKNGDFIYIFNYKDVEERNETYEIQSVEPDFLLVGQDGDLGYFVHLSGDDDGVYSLDLGALGSLSMDKEANNIYALVS